MIPVCRTGWLGPGACVSRKSETRFVAVRPLKFIRYWKVLVVPVLRFGMPDFASCLRTDGLPCMCGTGSCECVEMRSCSFALLGKTGTDAVLSCFRSVSRRLSLRRLSGAAVSGRSADLLSGIRSRMSRACRDARSFGPSFRSALVGISRLGHDRRKVPLFVRPGKRGEIIFRPFRKFPINMRPAETRPVAC